MLIFTDLEKILDRLVASFLDSVMRDWDRVICAPMSDVVSLRMPASVFYDRWAWISLDP